MDLNIQRGDIVVCVLSGDFGKPRPAVVVQSDLFNPTHASITVCPVTTHLIAASLFRLELKPSTHNGLQKNSQIMIDKITSLLRSKVRQKIGTITPEQFNSLNHALRIWLNLGEAF